MHAGLLPYCQNFKLTGVFGEQDAGDLQRKGYKLGKTVGEGSYCKVKIAFRATELGFTQKCACKVVNKKRASSDFVLKFLPREISIIRTIRHPHIVSIFDIMEMNESVYIFMDYCEKGDLLNLIRTRGSLPDHRAKNFFRQLVSAVGYLHGRDIAHRDLKCENILLASRDSIKIADFGFSRWCYNELNKRVLSDTFCGSAAYAAPEIIQGTKYNPKMYDVWSLGCVLYIMLCATMPFDDTNVKEMLKIQLQRKLSFPTKCNLNGRVRRLIMHILEPDVTKRATIKQIAASSWINSPSSVHTAS